MKNTITIIILVLMTSLVTPIKLNAQSIGTGISISQTEIVENVTNSGHSLDGYKKSILNQEEIIRNENWLPTDYIQTDIQKNTYTIQLGDTLWEIADGYYGDGSRWIEILNKNSDKIGHLPDGSQALITPGDKLTLE